MIDGSDAGVRESLSCAMDGEATELELQRILKAMAVDPGLRAQWHRYQVVAAVVRGEQPVAPVDLSAGIRAAIDKLDVVDVMASPGVGVRARVSGAYAHRFKRVLLPLGRVAVAASVAVVAVLTFEQLQFGSAAPTPGVQVVQSGSGNEPVVRVASHPATSHPARGMEVLPDAQTPMPLPPLTHPAQVGARAVSMDSFVRQQQLDLIDGQTLMGDLSQGQIQAYLSALIARHEASSEAGSGAYSVEYSLQNQGGDGR